MRGNNDGKVSKQEWTDYYTDLSSSTPSDDYFCVMMEQAWGVAEDNGSKDFKDQVRELIKLMRQRLITIANGQQEEYKLKQIFEQFDTNKSGTITVDELAALMASLKISCERKYLMALLRELDSNNSGMLEFEEFSRFVIHDPYTK
jgi:Ca2+-binding EF-hand superfamily protein